MVKGMKTARINSLSHRAAMLLAGFILVFTGIGMESVWAEDCIADDWDYEDAAIATTIIVG